jgi:hypothetical protein
MWKCLKQSEDSPFLDLKEKSNWKMLTAASMFFLFLFGFSKSDSQDLRQKIIDIRIKSDESEEMVKSISNEIRYLDIGKRNLTTTISSLKKLQMLSM